MQLALFAPTPKEALWFTSEGCKYHIIDSEKKLARLAEVLRDYDMLAVDVETTGLIFDRDKIVGLSICPKEGLAFYLPLNAHDIKLSPRLVTKYLKGILETKNIIGHNLKFDYKFIRHHLGIDLNCSDDTYIMAKFLDCFDGNRLKHLAAVLFGFNVVELDDIVGDFKITYAELGLLKANELYEYCCQDTDLTMRLYSIFVSKYGWERSYIYTIEIDLIRALSEMEMRGIRLDKDFLSNVGVEYSKKMEEYERRIKAVLGESININSTQQLGEAIVSRFPGLQKELEVTERTGAVKLSKQLMWRYEHTLAAYMEKHSLDVDNVFKLINERKKLYSVMTKYIYSLIERMEEANRDYISTQFNSIGAATGRMSSNDPNMQNIPVYVRHAFIPRDGYYFVSMDYKQMEFRILVAMAGLDHLIEDVNNDVDIHKRAAALLNNITVEEVTKPIRDQAKTLNFGLLYGMGIHKLAETLHIPIEEARDLKYKYEQRFLKGTNWFDRVLTFTKQHGYVQTAFGRRREIENINIQPSPYADHEEQKEARKLFGEARRKAINTPIQGTSADITKIALKKVSDYIRENKLDVHPLAVVHDDILYEVSEKYSPDEIVPQLRECMEILFKGKIWLRVDTSISKASWGGLKDG